VFDTEVGGWGTTAYISIALVFVGVYIYDLLVKTVLKDPRATFWGGWILASGMVYFFVDVGHFSYRGAAIHLGAMFGSFMAFNVWYRIWPAQKKVINAIKAGEAPEPAALAMAGSRSKHNTYMSVPLVFAMISQHATWAATAPYNMSLAILVGWAFTYWMYKKAPTVKGF